MNINLLKLNNLKTEVLIIGSKRQLKKVKIPHIKIGESEIQPSKCARNIGATFDCNMSFVQHVDDICKSSWYHLHNIRRIRKYLTDKATKTLIHAFITARLDNLNSLLFGLPQKQIQRLQRIQNCAARTILNGKKFDHITPLLMKLHWLPVEERIKFGILLLTYKALNDLGPQYIKVIC